MIAKIDEVRDEEDSIGGIVSVRIENFPAGIGDPWFNSVETDIAAAIMSIPATRGIEFGTGFKAANMKGSEHNDNFIIKDGKPVYIPFIEELKRNEQIVEMDIFSDIAGYLENELNKHKSQMVNNDGN